MYKINLVTTSDIMNFVKACESVEGRVELFCRNTGYRVNAKSMLGALAAMEFDNLYVDADIDIYSKIEPWVMTQGDDGNYIHK